MELIGLQSETYAQGSELNARTLSPINSTIGSSYENSIYIKDEQAEKSTNKNEFHTNSPEGNNDDYDLDVNHNFIYQNILENNNLHILEKYADFVMNGHFLLGSLSNEKSDDTNIKECPKCNKKLKSRDLFIKHFLDCFIHQQSSVVCPKCGKTMKNRNSLGVHLVYCGKEPHLHCSNCSYRTKYKRDLILHCERIHLKKVKFGKTLNDTA